MHTKFRSGSYNRRGHVGDLVLNGRIKLKCTLKKEGVMNCTGFSRLGTTDGLL